MTPKIRFRNGKLLFCYTCWLLMSFVIGSIFSTSISINFLNNIFFVKSEMVKEVQLYHSVMTCIFFLAPFIFIYVYKFCISEMSLEREHLWLPILVVVISILWNTGTISIHSDGHYKYDVLFRYLIQEFDWVAAVFLSWFGLFMAIQFSAVLLVYYKTNK